MPNNKHQAEKGTPGGNKAIEGDGGRAAAQAYWKANLALLVKLLAAWFVISFGCGILFVDLLNEFRFFGFKLGFWFAQQGAIYGFIILIFIYVIRMRQIERAFGIDKGEDAE